MINTFGTGKCSDDKIMELVLKNFDMRPKAIIEGLGLLKPFTGTLRVSATSQRRHGFSMGENRQKPKSSNKPSKNKLKS